MPHTSRRQWDHHCHWQLELGCTLTQCGELEGKPAQKHASVTLRQGDATPLQKHKPCDWEGTQSAVSGRDTSAVTLLRDCQCTALHHEQLVNWKFWSSGSVICGTIQYSTRVAVSDNFLSNMLMLPDPL